MGNSNSSFSYSIDYFLYFSMGIFVFKTAIKKLLFSMSPFFLEYSPMLVVKWYYIRVLQNMNFKTFFSQCILILIYVSVVPVAYYYYRVAFKKQLSNFAYDNPTSATSLSDTPPTTPQINLHFIEYFFNMHIDMVSIYDRLTIHTFDVGALSVKYFFELLYANHKFFKVMVSQNFMNLIKTEDKKLLLSMLPFRFKYSSMLVVKWYYYRISQNIKTSFFQSLISIDIIPKFRCIFYSNTPYVSFCKVHKNIIFHLNDDVDHPNYDSNFTFSKIYLNLTLCFFVLVIKQFKFRVILLFTWIIHQFKILKQFVLL